MKIFRTALCGITLGFAAMTVTPALAQDGDIVVSGPYVELPDGRLLSSQVISYADLDLSLSSHRLELRQRITSTARSVLHTPPQRLHLAIERLRERRDQRRPDPGSRGRRRLGGASVTKRQ